MSLSKPIQIRMGGYGPPTTSFSQALKLIGDRLEAQFGDAVDIKYIWNILDLGYRGEDILWLAEHGFLTIAYQSTSYLTDRVPELGYVDLPYLFDTNEKARTAIDGALGKYLTQKIEERVNYRVLGYFENGFRQISNQLRPVHTPSDLADMRIRVLPSDVQARSFELMGAKPLRQDLSDVIKAINDGKIDAQENPLANTVTYGVHKLHPYHTITNHFYISRGIFANRTAYYGWPEEFKEAMNEAVQEAVVFQRGLAVEEAKEARASIEKQGCEIVDLTPDEHDEFVKAVKPQLDDARQVFGDEILSFR
ncbi:MAG: TRAP transporter substrate-binding protein [Nitrospinaceae bacterium]|jgi:TRAP-type transport system periplasmic protein|nr:TRAP transporter substrate-binding protein [Nitrospinaceae bacterium]MBT3432428.1 TRAP transporter substrate-binding protein [Nitrospinaceae bacterium]MBT4094643.1 TRAP transporter substrate-binding protein [Nitrospinaceae bacterium]MBT4430854.1 TRAP transporter substrate-binding protein [Nitrospinaceae bacterium]MBT5368270.1 TRAP transporter substrate-binding protein [Nitrospinaceae bacterium]